MPRTRSLLPLAAVLALGLSGCAAVSDDGRPQVLASIYPLQFLAQEIAGDRAVVGSVTPAGAEPHDLELAPVQVRAIGSADVLVYVSGFQPAIDDALALSAGDVAVVDATDVLALGGHVEPAAAEHPDSDGAEADDEADADDGDGDGHDDGDHAGDEHDPDDADDADDHDGHEGHDHDGDPHFWLDPTLLAALAGPVADALSTVDPEGAETFAANAARVAAELEEIDVQFAARLASCERHVVVVAHEAYGFLTERYGLTQVGLSGLDPEGEPSPARMREIRATISEHDVTTVFTESLVNPKAAEVLAADLGLVTALLDPVEAQIDPEADYRDVMRANLEELTKALGCV